MTIRHVVMWRVQGNTSEERRVNAERVRNAFETMQGQVAGMMYLEVGLNLSEVDYACDVVLISDFDSAASLQAYATHPAHLKAKALAGDLRTERHQVDFFVPSESSNRVLFV